MPPEQLKNAVFLTSEMERRTIDFDRARVKIDDQLPGTNNAVGMAFAAADDGVDARHQFTAVEGFRKVIVGAETKAFDLVIEF
jgi:hypothetical protein